MDFEMQRYGVYIKTDSDGRIIAINSDAFLSSTEGWSRLCDGVGDMYHHAQGNFLPKPIMDERGVYRYKLVDGQVQERTTEEMDADYIPPTTNPTPDGTMTSLAAEVAALRESNTQLQEALDLLLSGEVE